MGLRMGAAAWGCAGAQHRGATQGRSSVGLRGAQQRGAAQGHGSVVRWWLLGVASGEWEDGGGHVTGV